MQILLSTTGTSSPISLPDLNNITFTHPVTSFNLLTVFTLEELYESEDLFAQITAGTITVVDNLGHDVTTDFDLSPVSEIYLEGWQGMQGAQGAQGRQGFQGFQGTGANGVQGPQGFQGFQGFQSGIQGNQGPQGRQGWQGFQGFQSGIQGNQGFQGFQDAVGRQGFQGPIGYQGNQGNQGFQGFQGFQSGIQGNQGPQGRQGFQGFQGFQSGIQGNQGSQGWQGFQSVIGPQGNQGFQGWQGFQGFQDAVGRQGFQGFQGFQGRQGWQGFQGFQSGIQGNQGPQGFQGFQSVIGPQGNQGFQGWQGFQDAVGRQGFQGFQGFQGWQGFQSGIQGNQGPQGRQGWQGFQDAVGRQGFQGWQGRQGFQGFQDAVGRQGFQGYQGWQGNIDISGLPSNNILAATNQFPFFDGSGNRQCTVVAIQAVTRPASMSGGYVTRSGNNLLFAPDKSNTVWLYESSMWRAYLIDDAGITVACTGLTVSTAYYLYVYDNAGTLTLDLSTTAPTTQNGISVKTGATGRLLIARCYADASGNIVDYLNDASTHLINNVYNKRLITLSKWETTNNWTYNSSTYRSMNNLTANRVQFVADGQNHIRARVSCVGSNATGYWGYVGLGLDVTNANSCVAYRSGAYTIYHEGWGLYLGVPSAGFHYLQAVEASGTNGQTITFYGAGGWSAGVEMEILA